MLCIGFTNPINDSFQLCVYLSVCHVFPLCPYHNQFLNDLVVFYYPDDTVDVGCKYQVMVDNMMNQ